MNKKFWNIKNDADGAEIMLYGEISDHSWYGDEVTPRQFANDLKTLGGKNLTVAINSGGGDVFAAQAIYHQLKYYPGNVTVRIDGICASAATIVACAGDTVIMPANAIYMIHNPAVAVIDYLGADEARKIAGQLDTVKDTIVAVYEARLKGALNSKKIAKLMDEETWMNAETAKNYGFVDEISPNLSVENSLIGNKLVFNSVDLDLSKFKNTAKIRDLFAEKAQKQGILGSNCAEKAAKLPEPTSTKEEKTLDEKSKLEFFDGLMKYLGFKKQEPEQETPQEQQPTPVVDAVTAERQRVAALDALKDGRKSVDALIETAKKNGQTVEEIKPFVDAMPAEKGDAAALDAIKQLIIENKASGADSVKSLPVKTAAENTVAQKQRDIEEIANLANKMRGLA